MVHHLVFFNLNDGVSAADAVSRLHGLKGLIPELITLEAGESISGDSGQWDVGLYTTFSDRDALEAYRVHPEHQKVVEWLKANTSARTFVDFET
ncbi:MAG: Dabb family protein [Opitutales bacterium]